MENDIEKIQLELDKPYEINERVLKETRDFLDKSANPNLDYEEWKRMRQEFETKAKENPEYRLAYLRQSTKNPDTYISSEIHELESQPRKKLEK